MYQELELIRTSLLEYVESAYHISNDALLEMRRQLLDSPGMLSQSPYLESSAKYKNGAAYGDLQIPPPAKELLSFLASDAGGKVIYEPPYSHQADALEIILAASPQDVIATTGTGSGKTELFLLPILGRFANEAIIDPTAFRQRAVRAMVLYPMNALVNDQLGRLRLLFGAPSTCQWFTEKAGRPIKFGRYTSRTPFPGIIPPEAPKINRKLTGLKFYLALEQRIQSGDKEAQRLVRLLREQGKWPRKPSLLGTNTGLSEWFGKGRWFDQKTGELRRTVERPQDPELLTRHEMQDKPPDLLVTNYSMLEYMMLRPIERSIFDRSHDYFAHHPKQRFVLVLDESHLYRGAQGTEVAMLIRRLRARLGLATDQFQVICTSASFGNPERARQFAAGLTGTRPENFAILTGEKVPASPSGEGEGSVATALAGLDLKTFRQSDRQTRFAMLRPLCELPEAKSRLRTFRYRLRVLPQDAAKASTVVRFAGLDAAGHVVEEQHQVAVGGEVWTTGCFLAALDLYSDLSLEAVREDGGAGLQFDHKNGVSVPRDKDDLSRLLFDVLSGLPVTGRLLNLTSGTRNEVDPETADTSAAAQEIERLSVRLFPGDAVTDLARRATDALVELASLARPSPKASPLLAARVHRFFRGVPGLWACCDPQCSALTNEQRGSAPTGKLYVQPQRACDCGARVFELHTCRSCGTAYFHAWANDPTAPAYLWNQDVGEIDDVEGVVEPLHVLLEDPSDCTDANRQVREAYLDPFTGRISDSPSKKKRCVWLPAAGSNAAEPGKFTKCPHCNSKGTDISDLATKGDEPFQQLIAAQLLEQPPRTDVQTPLKGRKTLIFSDGRQPASRLAGKLKDNSLRDSVRPLLLDGFRALAERWPERQNESQTLRYVYAALLVGARRNDVTLTPQLRAGELSFHDHVQRIKELIDHATTDWRSFSEAAHDIGAQPPHAILLALYEVICNRQTGVHALALAAMVPCLNDAAARTLAGLRVPADTLGLEPANFRLALVELWMHLMIADRAVLLPGTPAEWIDSDQGARLRLEEARFTKALGSRLGKKFHQQNFAVVNGVVRPWLQFLRASLGCSQNAGRFLLQGSYVAVKPGNLVKWLRCNRCTSVLPDTPLLGSKCTYCEGTDSLQSLDIENAPVFRKRKGIYRRLTERLQDPDRGVWAPHPFVAEEHTAAIGSIDSQQAFSRAEWHEMRFQDLEVRGPSGEPGNPVDVLSCTTTMEVGIDIGSLTAVALRNVPPSRANYQQRAGRAGRRGAALSTVITYADQGSHDQRFFEDPAAMISGPVADPLLNLDNSEIVRRHAYALILSLFQRARISIANLPVHARADVFSALGKVDDFRRGGAEAFSFRGLQAWIDQSRPAIAESLRSILPAEFIARHSVGVVAALPDELLARLQEIEVGPLQPADEQPVQAAQAVLDLGADLDEDWDDDGLNGDETANDDGDVSDKAEVADASRDLGMLLDRLFDQAVLPSYAFPTDVVSMTVFDRMRSTPWLAVAKYSPQLGLTQALSSYAPGREVFIDGLRHYSFAIWSAMGDARREAWEKRQLYYQCQRCGFADLKPRAEGHFEGEALNCTACGGRRTLGPAMLWMVPPGFAHPIDMQEDLAMEEPPDFTRPTRAKLSAPFQDPEEADANVAFGDRGFTKWGRKEDLLVTNCGNLDHERPGFVYCTFCGRIEPSGWLSDRAFVNHRVPHPKPFPDHRGQGEQCTSKAIKRLSLGSQFRSDVVLYRLRFGSTVRLPPGSSVARIVLTTLAHAMSSTAVQILQIERNNVGGEYRPAMTPAGQAGAEVDIYLYDTTSGGAGFVQAAASDSQAFLQHTLKRLEECDCTHSCYKCLHTYENRYVHADLDRKLGAAVLRHVLNIEEAPQLDRDVEDRLLRQLARELEDSGEQVELRDGFIDLPGRGHRRIVLADALCPGKPGSSRAEKAAAKAAHCVAVDHLRIERALPAAVRDAIGIIVQSEDTAWKLPAFLQVESAGGLEVHRFEDLQRGWDSVVPQSRIAALMGEPPGVFVIRLEYPTLEKMPLTLTQAGQQCTVTCLQQHAWISLLRPASAQPTKALNRAIGIVRHKTDTFRATQLPITIGVLQVRELENRSRLNVSYRSRRRDYAPETINVEDVEILAVMTGVYYNGVYYKV